MTARKNSRVFKPCSICGEVFFPFQGREKTSRFCSRQCNGVGQSKERAAKNFWARVQIKGPNDCWPWLGTKKPTGYGTVIINGKTTGAHRLALELSGASFAKEHVVSHACDNPSCCNPAHLRATTQAQNVLEACAKGRVKVKLSPDDIHRIRNRADGYLKYKEAAALFGVSEATIIAIRRGDTWKWLPPPTP